MITKVETHSCPKYRETLGIHAMVEILDDRIVRHRLADDRRDTCRMPDLDDTEGILRIGSKTVTVEVVDESSGGFLILADKIPKTSATQEVELITSSGRHPLRIVWRRTVDGKTRMGLQRMPEEIEWRQESSWVIWMLAAIVLGFGVGYIGAFRDQDSVARGIIIDLSTLRVVANE